MVAGVLESEQRRAAISPWEWRLHPDAKGLGDF